MQFSPAIVRGFVRLKVSCVPVSDRWIGLVLMIYSKGYEMKNLLKYVVLSITVFVSNYANSASVFINLPSINLTSPTTEDFIVAEISGSYATPNFVLNSSPTIDIGIGGINITFDVSSPSGIQPFILDPFNYSVDIGQLSAGDWYVTPIFYVDGAFDSQLTTLLPLFSVTAVPVPATVWLFGSGLIGLIGIAKRKACI